MTQMYVGDKNEFKDFLSEQEEIDQILEQAQEIFEQIQRSKNFTTTDLLFSVFPRDFKPKEERRYAGHEVEMRFGTFVDTLKGKRFIPGVPKEYFYNFLNVLLEKYPKIEPIKTITYINNEGIRISVGKKIEIDKKTSIQNSDYPQWGVRIAVSLETKMNDLKNYPDYQNWPKRNKTRWSFNIENKIVELTISTTPSEKGQITAYEVEVEYPSSQETMTRDYEVITSHMQKTSIKNILSDDSISLLIKNFNNLLSNKETDFFDRIENKPVSFDWSNVFYGNKYFITPKLDGVRKRLFFDINGVFEIVPGTRFARQISKPVKFTKSIIDTEFYEGKYYPFDILVNEGTMLITLPFSYRLEALSNIYFDLFGIKPFYPGFYDGVEKSLNWMKTNKSMKFDGLIAQSDEPVYAGSQTMKIKPLDELTVDLYTRIDEKNQVRLYSWSGNSLKEENFSKPGEEESLKTTMGRYTVKNLKLPVKIKNDFIAEYRFIKEEPYLVYKGMRNEKINPNFHKVVASVYRDYFISPVSYDDLRDQTLMPWRKWASSVKRRVINDFVPAGGRVLDIGIGRGGTIYDTAKRASAVYGIDPDIKNLESLNQRFDDKLLSNVDIINAKGQDTEKIRKFIGTPVDVILSMFSLSFFYESQKDLNAFVNTCKESLIEGGRLVIMFMDGERVRIALNNKTANNHLLKITCKQENIPKNTVGVPITIELLNETDPIFKIQKEWLAPFDILVEKLKEAGFNRLGSGDGFLDKDANLPTENLTFAKFNRLVVFEKGQKISVNNENYTIKNLEIGKSDVINGHWKRFGVQWDESSFLRSYLYSISDEYKNEPNDKLVKKLRKDMLTKYTKEVFRSLKNKNVENRIAFDLLYKNKNDTKEKALNAAFEEYKKRIESGIVGHECAGILILLYPNRKIVIIDENDKEIDRIGTGEKTTYILKVGTYAYSPISKVPGYIHKAPEPKMTDERFIKAIETNDHTTIDNMIANGYNPPLEVFKVAVRYKKYDIVEKLLLQFNVNQSIKNELINIAKQDPKMTIILGGTTKPPVRRPQQSRPQRNTSSDDENMLMDEREREPDQDFDEDDEHVDYE